MMQPTSGRSSSGKRSEPGLNRTPPPDLGEAFAFLNYHFSTEKRHIVAIKKSPIKGKRPRIEAEHFEAADLTGQQAFITAYNAAGFDIYFSVNPIKDTLHKKATKADVLEARWLWIDADPRPDKPLEAERAEIFARLTTNLPPGMPKPNRVIDSGRGYWGFCKLSVAQPVDGDGPLTEAVEARGRGIEQAFGEYFADDCRNIDRIARLPGTVNHKTGRLARVLHEFSHDEPHAIEAFPQSDKKDSKPSKPQDDFSPVDNYEPIEPDDPALAKLGAKWIGMLTADNYAADYKDDRSRAEMAFATAAIRAGIDDQTIARCLMDERRAFGGNTRTNPEYLLARIIDRAHQYAADPVLEQMNQQFSAGFIGSKFRVAKFDPHPKYPLQTHVEFLTKDDFINGIRNPPVEVEEFDKKGQDHRLEIGSEGSLLVRPARPGRAQRRHFPAGSAGDHQGGTR
jgi:hypothetical protein